MCRVLVVEDEPVSRELLTEFLVREGLQVQAIGSYREVAAASSAFDPEVLVCDWLLKDDYTGLDVAEAILQHKPQVKVIFVTGMSADSIEMKVRHLPYYTLVQKPFEWRDFVTLVRGIAKPA